MTAQLILAARPASRLDFGAVIVRVVAVGVRLLSIQADGRLDRAYRRRPLTIRGFDHLEDDQSTESQAVHLPGVATN